MRPTSDVDVAVEGDLTAEDCFALWRELERAAAGWLIETLTRRKAQALKRTYWTEIEWCLAFLDGLIQTGE